MDTTTDPYKIEASMHTLSCPLIVHIYVEELKAYAVGRKANQAGINSPVSTTPSTTTAIDAMRLNQNTLDSLPQPDCGPLLSLDGYTNQSSTSDTMKSLLNAIMRTVPPVTSSSEEVGDQHITEQSSHQEQNQREQERPHDFCHLDLMHPSPAAGNSSIPFPVVLGTPENTQPAGPPDFHFSGSSPVSYSLLLNEDSSSLGAVITGLSRRSGTETLQPAGGEISLSDSLACKKLSALHKLSTVTTLLISRLIFRSTRQRDGARTAAYA
ncbi:unnamed protein product [Dibothriocephalus latus]|uniref:Uncharacterized protein n=1 Tax=Dibothriocephalus latus TaxID=60516 RepID=A0A3P7P675_DIBLA|nr:unnamed protein product [Dibothriocephalus latus]